MIINLLLQIAGILVGVLLLTLIYYLVVHVDTIYSNESTAVHLDKHMEDNRTESVRIDDIPLRAVIRCDFLTPEVALRFRMVGYTECNVANTVFGGNESCTYGCLGLESCAKICPNDAIRCGNGKITITDACDGCGRCVHICPKKLIMLVPATSLDAFSCAAAKTSESLSSCATAASGYSIDYHNLPESGFKILHNWGILSKK